MIISDAFMQYMREESDFPTPDRILAICEKIARREREKAEPIQIARPANRHVRTTDSVAWTGMSLQEIKEKGYTEQLDEHLAELEKTQGKRAVENYLKYLKSL